MRFPCCGPQRFSLSLTRRVASLCRYHFLLYSFHPLHTPNCGVQVHCLNDSGPRTAEKHRIPPSVASRPPSYQRQHYRLQPKIHGSSRHVRGPDPDPGLDQDPNLLHRRCCSKEDPDSGLDLGQAPRQIRMSTHSRSCTGTRTGTGLLHT